MIFITAGTIHFPFERLVQIVDAIQKENVKKEKIIFQHGFTSVVKKNSAVEYIDFIDSAVFIGVIKKARLVIAQGGPATIYQTLYAGKKPWVLPRKKMFGEHVNDHQLIFCNMLEKKGHINRVDQTRIKTMLKLGSQPIKYDKETHSSRSAIIKKLDQIIQSI